MSPRIFRVSSTLLPLLFGPGERHYRVISDALPADTRIVNVTLEFPHGQGPTRVTFLLESEEWTPVPDGARIPEICPMLTEVRPAL